MKQTFFFPGLLKWIKILIHDCLNCQQNKSINTQQQTATTISFADTAPCFNHRVSMDSKGPITPTSDGHTYIIVMIDHFTRFVVTVPIPEITAQNIVLAFLFAGFVILAHQNTSSQTVVQNT